MATPKTVAEIDRLNALMRQLLSYDPQTGIFRWCVKRKRVFAGDIAGSVSPLGYRMIAIDKRDYAAQNLAWLWMTRRWPDAEVDHIDLNKDNNCWSNLRPATRSQNCANKPVQKSSILGVKGVGLDRRGKYRAKIHVNGKTISLGYFSTIEEARTSYALAARVYFGEYART